MDDISSNIDQRLIEAYLATTYEVKHLGLHLQIGVSNWHLYEFLIDNNAFTWAFVSAYNPFSQLLDLEENEKRHKRLLQFTKAKNWIVVEGQGIPANSHWLPEKSLLILDISRQEAIDLGKMMKQNAIVFGDLKGVPELVFI